MATAIGLAAGTIAALQRILETTPSTAAKGYRGHGGGDDGGNAGGDDGGCGHSGMVRDGIIGRQHNLGTHS